ncbi:MAG: hypothetical protein JXR44_03850 [Thiotrichales bacterium]|nr:hypothetical protein [Thiotrichales bacterium]
MANNYQELQALLEKVTEKLNATRKGAKFQFSVAENKSFVVKNLKNAKQFRFTLAKLGDELKVGFAYYETEDPQPDWIEDIKAGSFTEKYVTELLLTELN